MISIQIQQICQIAQSRSQESIKEEKEAESQKCELIVPQKKETGIETEEENQEIVTIPMAEPVQKLESNTFVKAAKEKALQMNRSRKIKIFTPI